MDKLFCSVFAFLSLAACTGADAIKGNEYVLVKPPYATEITIGFAKDENRYFGQVLNYYFGNYTLGAKTIKFNMPASTKMAGPENIMKAEDEYLKEISGPLEIKTEGNKLILKNKAGKEFVFEKKSASVNSAKQPE